MSRARAGGLAALAAVTAALTIVRAYAATRVGFGDSEALYAAYALHPQPAYLDHPGMIALLARAVGHGTAPTPAAAHAATTVLAGLVPWLAAVAARAAGATWRAALIAALALALVPEIAIGLFAMTPDLLLAPAWLGALACAAMALRVPPKSASAVWLFAGAGLLAGAACASKATGGLLVLALVATYASKGARAHARTPWPWIGLAAGALVIAPVIAFEAGTGWPMLRHRLVDTQHDAGLSLRNAGALLGGQLVYLSPLYAIAAVIVARDLVRARRSDAVSALLFASFAWPLAALVALGLWSRVAEPHWLAPPLLALPIHAARVASSGRALVSRRLLTTTVASGAILIAAVHAWVLVPSSARLLPASFDPRFDLANELYGWPRAVDGVRQAIAAAREHAPGENVMVVGPHWTVCAQLDAALRDDALVGCDTPIRDDFDDWLPRRLWRVAADTIVWVRDNRFPDDAAARFPDRAREAVLEITVTRAGRVARVFTIELWEKKSDALLGAPRSLERRGVADAVTPPAPSP